jgi:two-component system sensor histidine kinase KdpD
LLAAVSHDLRTPLTTIKALAHAVASEGDPGSRARAASIEEEADRLNRTVADLLDLSRLDAGALTVRPELNAVEDLIGATLQRVSGVTGGREIVVHPPLSAPLLVGRFDFVHALRALGNLVENALRYSPSPAPVELSFERDGDVLRISVGDRGPGIAPDEERRIFEPFYRPEGARPDVGGAGLGLAIASRLAHAQGGRVYYEPRRGGGSIFVLELPASEPPIELVDVDAGPAFGSSGISAKSP